MRDADFGATPVGCIFLRLMYDSKGIMHGLKVWQKFWLKFGLGSSCRGNGPSPCACVGDCGFGGFGGSYPGGLGVVGLRVGFRDGGPVVWV